MSYTLTLPQFNATFSRPLPQTRTLLVAGGRAPQNAWLKEAAANKDIWCADHGLDACIAASLTPQHLIGDGDSASSSGWAWSKAHHIPTEKFSPLKDLTDTQLALQKIKETYETTFVIFTGVWGGRFDHAFSNIYSLQGFCDKHFSGCAADDKEVLLFLKGTNHVSIDFSLLPESISLLPLEPNCTGVSIDGVYWPLDKVELNTTLPYAISNKLAASSKQVKVSLTAGIIGIYCQWNEKELIS
jgi:thiamine pyrophosphokinase